MDKVFISLIVVNHNTKSLLKNCLDSVLVNIEKYPYEIIVVDNNSTDSSRELIKNYKNIRVIYNENNLGFAKANNLGIEIAKGDYLLLLNSDTIVLPNSIDRMVDFMEKNPTVGILGPKLVDKNGEIIQVSWEFMPTIFSEVIKRILSPKSIRKYPFLKYIVKFLQRKTKRVPVITGASMLVRRKVFEQIGLFDESFFLYFEEPDFCIRAKKAGWTIIFYPDAGIIHMLGQTMKQNIKSAQLQYRISQILYYRKNLSKIQQNILNYYLKLKGYEFR